MDKTDKENQIPSRTSKTSEQSSTKSQSTADSTDIGSADLALRGAIARLLAAFPSAKISSETIALYTKHLADVPPDALLAAIDQVSIEEEFFPPIAVIRKKAIELGAGALPTASEAWAEVIDALSEVSENMACRPKLSNSIAQQIADSLGWRRLYLYQDLYRNSFVSAYREAAERRESDMLLSASVRLRLQSQSLLIAGGQERDEDDYEQ